MLDVRPDMTVWPLEPAWSNPAYQGFGRPRKPKLLREQRLTVEGRSLSLPEGAWREVTVAEGTQGPRTYMFSAQRVRVTRRRKPGEVVWAVYRRNLDGSEPRYYLSNAPEDTPLERWLTWAGQDGALRPNSRPKRATWDWMSTKRALGPVGITISPCACWAGHSC